MQLKSINLQNYKSHKNFTAQFDGMNKLIQGNKGSGKTSIKDAFTWLLTGRMVDDPTPVDEHGVLINHQKIIVACEFMDGTTLKIEDTQKWVKDELKANHNATYYINETPCLEKDYLAYLEETIGTLEDRRIMLDPEFFAVGDGLRIAGKTPKTATQRRREKVIALAGAEHLETQIAENENRMKRAKFAISTLKKEQDDAYAGVESLNDAKVDVSHINRANMLEAIEQLKIQETETIKGLETLNSGNDTQNALQRALSDAQTLLSQERSQYSLEYNKRLEVARKPYNEYIVKKQNLEIKINDAAYAENQQSLKAARLISDIDALRTEHRTLGTQYKALESENYVPNSTSCQTCLQPLPAEQLIEAQARFNKNKSDGLEKIKNQGLNLNATIDAKEKELSLQNIDYGVDALRKELAFLDEPVIEEILPFEKTSRFTELNLAIGAAQLAVTQGDDNSTKDIYQRKIDAIQLEMNQYRDQLKGFDTNDHLDIAIANKSKELKTIAENMDEQNEIVDECNEFTRKTLDSLEEAIEKAFDGLRFKMFEYTLDGTQRDTCITYAKTDNGYIPWDSLSGGQKRSATIKLANAFAKAWGKQVPLFIDDTQIYVEDELASLMQLIRITEVPHTELVVK